MCQRERERDREREREREGERERERERERVEKIMVRGNGGSILVHVGTNNADKEGTTAIVEK